MAPTDLGHEGSFYYELLGSDGFVLNTFSVLMEAGRWESNDPPSLYLFINCSTRELGAIEKYVVCRICFHNILDLVCNLTC